MGCRGERLGRLGGVLRLLPPRFLALLFRPEHRAILLLPAHRPLAQLEILLLDRHLLGLFLRRQLIEDPLPKGLLHPNDRPRAL